MKYVFGFGKQLVHFFSSIRDMWPAPYPVSAGTVLRANLLLCIAFNTIIPFPLRIFSHRSYLKQVTRIRPNIVLWADATASLKSASPESHTGDISTHAEDFMRLQLVAHSMSHKQRVLLIQQLLHSQHITHSLFFIRVVQVVKLLRSHQNWCDIFCRHKQKMP